MGEGGWGPKSITCATLGHQLGVQKPNKNVMFFIRFTLRVLPIPRELRGAPQGVPEDPKGSLKHPQRVPKDSNGPRWIPWDPIAVPMDPWVGPMGLWPQGPLHFFRLVLQSEISSWIYPAGYIRTDISAWISPPG